MQLCNSLVGNGFFGWAPKGEKVMEIRLINSLTWRKHLLFQEKLVAEHITYIPSSREIEWNALNIVQFIYTNIRFFRVVFYSYWSSILKRIIEYILRNIFEWTRDMTVVMVAKWLPSNKSIIFIMNLRARISLQSGDCRDKICLK